MRPGSRLPTHHSKTFNNNTKLTKDIWRSQKVVSHQLCHHLFFGFKGAFINDITQLEGARGHMFVPQCKVPNVKLAFQCDRGVSGGH